MNIITFILLWLGIITSPEQATDSVISENAAAIEKAMQTPQESNCADAVIYLDEID